MHASIGRFGISDINMKSANDHRFGGIFASQVIRLIDNIYSQTMRIYICGNVRFRIIADHFYADLEH